MFAQKQISDQEPAEHKKEIHGQRTVVEQSKVFEISQAVILPDLFNVVHYHQERSKKAQRIKAWKVFDVIRVRNRQVSTLEMTNVDIVELLERPVKHKSSILFENNRLYLFLGNEEVRQILCFIRLFYTNVFGIESFRPVFKRNRVLAGFWVWK